MPDNRQLPKFIVRFKELKTGAEITFDNNGVGFEIADDVAYIELGEIPITIRYSDYNKMFGGAITVIIQYTEQPAAITVITADEKYSRTLTLAGLNDYNDVGVFRLNMTANRR